MDYQPLNKRFLEAVDRFRHPRAQMYKGGNRWEFISAQEMLRRVAGVSQALAELGVGAGDRVGLFSANRPEWHIADFAILGLGAVDVPIYFKESPERMSYILNHSGAKVVMAFGAEQAQKLLACRGQLRTVEYVIVGSAPEANGEVLRYETLIAAVGESAVTAYRRRAAEVTADQLATLIYTSGTTGEPKGVMLTHRNLSSNVSDGFSMDELRSERDLALLFLPLAHVYERVMGYGYLFLGVTLAYVEAIEAVPQALVEVRPTVMAAVPRFFEKLYASILERGRQATGLRQKLFRWAMAVAQRALPWRAYGKPAPLSLRLEWILANLLVYSQIRAGIGGRLRIIFSGGAPLAKELAEFFWSVGIPIYQGYGLTETSPVVSTNYPANRVGSVGRPLANIEVRIADDGEILVRGPCVMLGYYQKSEETLETLSAHGWLHTGDIGYLDADGYLYVTERKKELLKTAAGKFVAPQPMENRLKASPFIANAAVVGDKRKFVAALIVPNFAAIQAQAREAGLEFASPAEMLVHPWVRERIALEVERVNAHLAQYETIKRFALLDRDFSYDAGELTYTMKLKRRVVEQRYHDVIESLYADVAEPRAQPLA